MKKIGLLVFVLVLLSTAVTVGFVRPVEPSGTIYISSDYTFTSNIYEPIVVTADNIIIDGAGYTVQGTGALGSKGIDLSYRNNVTIKNVEVTDFYYGIYLWSSRNNTVTSNNASSNGFYGIYLWSSSNNNTVTGNTVSSNGFDGIYLGFSINNTVTGNTASSNNHNGIYLRSSINNTVTGNTVSSNGFDGIYLGFSINNTVTGNTVSSNGFYGIYLFNSSDNTIYHNDFIDNTNQAFVTAGYTNIWDDGAGEGNYWTDYEDKYPDAEEIDGSGVWDTPYVIDEKNQDNYPIVPEFPTLISMLLLLVVLTVAIIIYKRRLLKRSTY
jgi:parallel beta-helix repeat protein